MIEINPDAECKCGKTYKEHFHEIGNVYCDAWLPPYGGKHDRKFTPVPAPSTLTVGDNETIHKSPVELIVGGDQKAMREPLTEKPLSEQYANLYIACVMNEMKPRSIIPKVKAAYIKGYKSRDVLITRLTAENAAKDKVIQELREALRNYHELMDEVNPRIPANYWVRFADVMTSVRALLKSEP